ncbi:MAG TPA: trimethylamine methyltransferase family protein, partial [Jatrophihabitantaceae bacterium]|nr:trimethylamine methyltransferase family protein [Jatrophihabitantaceae bacterium]
MFVNRMPRYEILSEQAIATLDGGWRRIVSEIGVEFILPEAGEVFAKAGQKTDGDKVFLDPDFVLEQVAKAPHEFDVQARNPQHSIHIGGDHMAFASVYGPPFVREGDVRRDATMQDFERFTMLSQSFDELDSAGGTICEPNDRPLDSRHLDMVFGSVYGPPFVREGDVRRVATMNDFEQFCKLSQAFPLLDSAGGTICEPDDAPLDSRHLDMVRALMT